MIDSHCHLEQDVLFKNLDEVIANCKKEGLTAVVTSCAHPRDFEKTIEIVKKYKKFVFATFGLHPEYSKEINDKEVDEYLQKIHKNISLVSGVGEVGLDFAWVTDDILKEKTKVWFRKMIDLANELGKPIIVHSRQATEDTMKILESAKTKVYWHMFMDKKFMEMAKERDYYIGIGPLVVQSKGIRKIAKQYPLERIVLETDSPWFGFADGKPAFSDFPKVIGYPFNVKFAAAQIAKERHIDVKEVIEATTKNAKELFKI